MDENTRLEERLKQLEAREKELARKELRALAVSTLAQKGLDASLAEVVSLESAEACLSSIDRLESAVLKEAARRMDTHGAVRLPGAGKSVSEEEMTDAEYYARLRGRR